MKILHFNFLPRSADLALLVLRLWFGLSMLLLHGWSKFTGFSAMAAQFGDPIGLGPKPSLVLAVFAELVCSALLVVGAWTRAAAIVLMINMGVAFWIAHRHVLTGAGSGELAFAYLGVYAALFFAGAGKFSVDANIGAKG